MHPLEDMFKDSKYIDLIPKIFSDIKVIIGYNSEFLQDLRNRLQFYDRHRTTIGDIFVKFADYFRTYTRYCNNYDSAIQTLEKCRKNVEFDEILKKMDKDSRTTKLGISSYLIKPIQRIPRYRLLLRVSLLLKVI